MDFGGGGDYWDGPFINDFINIDDAGLFGFDSSPGSGSGWWYGAIAASTSKLEFSMALIDGTRQTNDLHRYLKLLIKTLLSLFSLLDSGFEGVLEGEIWMMHFLTMKILE